MIEGKRREGAPIFAIGLILLLLPFVYEPITGIDWAWRHVGPYGVASITFLWAAGHWAKQFDQRATASPE